MIYFIALGLSGCTTQENKSESLENSTNILTGTILSNKTMIKINLKGDAELSGQFSRIKVIDSDLSEYHLD